MVRQATEKDLEEKLLAEKKAKDDEKKTRKVEEKAKKEEAKRLKEEEKMLADEKKANEKTLLKPQKVGQEQLGQ